MTETTADDSTLWAATLVRVRAELAELSVADRDWLARQMAKIGELQTELDRIFQSLGGPAVCGACLGECCSRARHHATLTNLLSYLVAGEEPPVPDYTQTCPYLGPRGCRLPVARRPFTCIIFFCEPLDARLTEAMRIAYTAAERELRLAYEMVAARCPGASLRGLLIGARRVGNGRLLFQR